MEKISAILIQWNRDLNPIINSLKVNKSIDEIIVWDNRIINYKTWGRYLAAQTAKNNLIYVQDDDCIVNIDRLVDEYDGRVLTSLKEQSFKSYINDSLVGWGSIFKKENIKVFEKYINKWGIDNQFMREADRIFTYFNDCKKILADIEDLPSAVDDNAMSFEKEHNQSRLEILNKCLEV